MQEFNGLLIVASALSVFCQYVDNIHRHEIEAIKHDMMGMEFPDGGGDSNLANLKQQWDDFLGKDCLRAKPYVVTLFCYLIAIVALISLDFSFSLFSLFSSVTFLKLNESLGLFFGLILFCVALGVGQRLVKMSSEVKDSKQTSRQLIAFYKALESVKNANAQHEQTAITQ